MTEEEKPQKWWLTLPGILTAIAGLITAVAGLILALHQAGVFGTSHKTGPQDENRTGTRVVATQTQEEQGAREAVVILHNDSQATIVHVYFGTAKWGGWSGEQLSDPVPPGSTHTWSLQPGAGIYDLKAEDDNHRVLSQETGVEVKGTYNWYVRGTP